MRAPSIFSILRPPARRYRYNHRPKPERAGRTVAAASVTPAGADTQVQYNDTGVLAASDRFKFVVSVASLQLGKAGDVSGQVQLNGDTTGFVTLKAPTNPSNVVFELPSSDGGAGSCLMTNGGGGLSFAYVNNTSYSAALSGNWASSSPPGDVWTALDRIAAALTGLSASP